MEDIKKKIHIEFLEMRPTMSEMKNTYILDRINSWLDIAEEKIGELEYVAIETSHNDTHRAQIYFFLNEEHP